MFGKKNRAGESVDREMRRRRKVKYKHLRKAFKARDMVSQYLPNDMAVKYVVLHYKSAIENMSLRNLALYIIDVERLRRTRPPAPPPRYVTRITTGSINSVKGEKEE